MQAASDRIRTLGRFAGGVDVINPASTYRFLTGTAGGGVAAQVWGEPARRGPILLSESSVLGAWS